MTLHAVLKSQYHACLAMLQEAIDNCPSEMWSSVRYVRPCWQIAYHTLYYADLYLRPSEAKFTPWELHRHEHHRFVGPDEIFITLEPFTPLEVTAYLHDLDARVDELVDRLDLSASESGFPRYQMSKYEHQLVSLRHIQHHLGQLSDRLRQDAGFGVRWVGSGPRRPG
jgi:hypothetical protein